MSNKVKGGNSLMGEGSESLQSESDMAEAEETARGEHPADVGSDDNNTSEDKNELAKAVTSATEADNPGDDGFGAAVNLLQRYVKLCRRKRALASEKREVQKQIDRIGPAIRDMLLQSGVQNMKVQAETDEGNTSEFTLYLHRQVWASPADGVSNAEAVKVLQEFGYDNMVMPTASAVSTLFRGDPEDVEGLHPKIRDTFDATEKVSVRVRKA